MMFPALFTLIFSGIFGFIGLIFFCIGLGFWLSKRKKQALCSATAEGELIALTPQRVLRYRVGELAYEKACLQRGPSLSRAHAIGERMTVHYDPSDPGNCYMDDDAAVRNVFIGVFGGLGLLFLLIATVVALILL